MASRGSVIPLFVEQGAGTMQKAAGKSFFPRICSASNGGGFDELTVIRK